MSEPPGRKGQTRVPSLGPRGEGWFVLQIVFIVVIAVAGFMTGANWSGALRFATALAGVVLMVTGAAMGYLGIRDLDRSLSPLPRPMDSAILISHGIYRRLRHPIYSGLILLAIGWGLVTASLLALALSLVLAIVLDLKARREEHWLHERFADYEEYSARTRKFVPGLY